MLISLNWLKDYIDLKEDISIKELENALTMIGQEVEKIEKQNQNLDKVLTSKIVKYEKHPDSDHLTICKVDNGSEILQVVCGAPNHKEGDIVAMAQVGAKLEDDFIIKKGKIRGVESNGMLCSEKELKIGEDSNGIMILPQDTKLGIPLNEYLGLNDTIFELEITPNRPDCLSHIGIARELCVSYNTKLKMPKINVVEEDKKDIEIEINNNVSDRYMARVIKNVTVKESPKWLKDRLNAVGIRSINNIVDISNYVMLEMNQPSHIFDYDKLFDDKIVIDYAKKGEKIITLDSREIELNEKDITVRNKDRVIALAGIMGSLDTEVSNETKNILIEVAHFDNLSVRKTSREKTISSESSYRFERSIDVDNMNMALDRITYLIKEIAGGIVCNANDLYLDKKEKIKTEFSFERMNRFIGSKIDREKVLNIFKNLEIEIEDRQDTLILTSPSHRNDLINQFDYFEEVIRMVRFDNIENILPIIQVKEKRIFDTTKAVSDLKILVSSLGLREVINYSFIPKNSLEKINFQKLSKEDIIEIKNPITEDFVILRPTLMYSLLKNARDNFNRSMIDIRFFEISKRFEKEEIKKFSEKEVYIDDKKVVEKETLSILLAGSPEKNLWDSKPEKYNFYHLKGIIENIFEKLGFNKYQLKRSLNISYHPGISADIFVGKDIVGTFGKIHPDVLEKMDLEDENILFAEIYFDKLDKYRNKKIEYRPLSKFQSVSRDLALVVKEDILVGDMLKSISKIDKIIESVELFDIYKGIGILENHKSVAINIVMRDENRTLEEKDITFVIDKIKEKLFKEFEATLRS